MPVSPLSPSSTPLPSAGTIRFRAVSPRLLSLGPVTVRSRSGIISWIIDERQIDPLIGAAFASFSQTILDGLQAPARRPDRVRIHRDHAMGGDQLLAADVTKSAIDVFVPAELMTQEVAEHIGLHGTAVLRHILRSMPVLGGWAVEL
jgi:hypothetical protein